MFDIFSPLKDRYMRLYLGGQTVSLLGTWMQQTAQSWVVWELSKSSAALGITATLGTLPFLLLGPWTGVWADRFDRRRYLTTLQIIAMVLALSLAALVQTGAVQLWHVYILSGLLGIVSAVELPVQQAFLGDLAGMAEVRKAVVLNNMLLQTSRTVGPTLAGWAIDALGIAGSFWANGLSFLAVIASLLAVRATQAKRPPAGGSPFAAFAEGASYVSKTPPLLDLILFCVLLTLFGLSNLQVMPAFASQVLQGDSGTLGVLMGAAGFGSLVGALVLAPLAQKVRRTGVVVLTASVWTGLWFTVLPWSPTTVLAMVSLFFTGMGVPVVVTTTGGLLQTMAPPAMRGRLLSLYLMVTFGIQPLASLLVGYTSELFGIQRAISANGLIIIVGALLLIAARTGLLRWEPAPAPATKPHTA